jgi:thiol-disulfide isomerase/thioredoxin
MTKRRADVHEVRRKLLQIPWVAGLALAVVIAARGAMLAATRVPAPDFSCKIWLNSPPLTLEKLRGKVVLIDFWEYTCINCIRTFPYLRRWNALYAPLGLVVIGVHTPEFAFGRDPARVAQAAKRFGFTFPIAVDSDYAVWNAFDNEAWPAKYLIDKDGRIAYVHIGEGDYAEFERHIQELLKEANPKLSFADPKFTPEGANPRWGEGCAAPTPETYLGFERGERIANAGGYNQLHEAAYVAPKTIPLDGYALSGTWIATPEAIADRAGGAALSLHYHAKSVYLVAGSDDGSPKPLYVTQDGRPLVQDARGVDVKSDAQGRTYIALAGKRMYYVVDNSAGDGEHTLVLSGGAPGLSLYSFTFGTDCENKFDHR